MAEGAGRGGGWDRAGRGGACGEVCRGATAGRAGALMGSCCCCWERGGGIVSLITSPEQHPGGLQTTTCAHGLGWRRAELCVGQ